MKAAVRVYRTAAGQLTTLPEQGVSLAYAVGDEIPEGVVIPAPPGKQSPRPADKAIRLSANKSSS